MEIQPLHTQPGAQLPEPLVLLSQVLARVAELANPAPDVEGLSPREAAKFLGISESQLHDLRNRGLMPDFPLMGDGRCVRIAKVELRAWLLAGCPSRARWVAGLRESWLKKVV